MLIEFKGYKFWFWEFSMEHTLWRKSPCYCSCTLRFSICCTLILVLQEAVKNYSKDAAGFYSSRQSRNLENSLVSKLVLSIRSAVSDGSLCCYHYCWVLWQYRTLVTIVETANANVCVTLELLNNGSAGFADMLRGNVLVFPVSSFICSLSHCTFMLLTAGILVS